MALVALKTLGRLYLIHSTTAVVHPDYAGAYFAKAGTSKISLIFSHKFPCKT